MVRYSTTDFPSCITTHLIKKLFFSAKFPNYTSHKANADNYNAIVLSNGGHLEFSRGRKKMFGSNQLRLGFLFIRLNLKFEWLL